MNNEDAAPQREKREKADGFSKPVQSADLSSGQPALNIQQSLERAMGHHSAGNFSEAASLYQQILQVEPNQPEALHLLGLVTHQTGNSDQAVDLISRALAIKPDFAEAYSNLGNIFKSQGKLDDAIANFDKAIATNPGFAAAHFNMANAFNELKRFDEAIAAYHKAIAIRPDYAEAHYNLGSVLHALQKLDDAVASFQKVISLKPDFTQAHNNLGNALRDLGKIDQAMASYQKAITIKPDFAGAHYNLAEAQREQGKLDEAVPSYQKAIVIKPDFAEAHYNLGNALWGLRKTDEALASYNQAIAIRPDYAEAYVNLGSVLRSTERLDEAVTSYQKALAIKPDFAEAHYNLGNVYGALVRMDEAIANYRQAIAIKPDYADAYLNLGSALRGTGRLKEAVASYRKALDIRPDYAGARSSLIYSLSFMPEISCDTILQEARRWDVQHGHHGQIPQHSNTRQPGRRLRIGLVSGDLRQHSVSRFLENILAEIDRDKLELFAYSTCSKEDEQTALLKSMVAHWRQATNLSDQQLAEGIIADGIDILVDLSGHTAHNRLAVFSMKPAPIQVTWLGYGGTTGVKAMDYILCDEMILPPSDEAHFTEKPWRLPGIWACFSPPEQDIEVAALPARANDHITFGSFNNLTKISDQTVSCWAGILKTVADSRLLLKTNQLGDADAIEETRARFAAHGIDPDQLILKCRSAAKEDHYRAYQQMDIALDPFPYAGATTSVEALWMATPVLTMKGDRFVSRIGESIVHNVGLGNWIAQSPQDYIEKAKALTGDLGELSEMRKNLRNRLLQSPVCNAARFAANLESAFQGMWQEWCARESAEK